MWLEFAPVYKNFKNNIKNKFCRVEHTDTHTHTFSFIYIDENSCRPIGNYTKKITTTL